MKSIKVTIEMKVPDHATDKDIQDYVWVEYEGVNSMRQNNPLIDECIVFDTSWEYD